MNPGLAKLKELINMGIRLVSKEWEILDESHSPAEASRPEYVGFTAKYKPTGKVYALTIIEVSGAK